MEFNWLWDSRLTEKEVAAILADEANPRFELYAEKLLSRIARPREVFRLLDQRAFCRKWPRIKRQMQKDRWLRNRALFWEAFYQVLKERFRSKGIAIRAELKGEIPLERAEIAKRLRHVRIEKGLSQTEVASRLGVVQQFISRVENGRENLSMDTLLRIAKALGKKAVVKLE